jgi:hypothetical protein
MIREFKRVMPKVRDGSKLPALYQDFRRPPDLGGIRSRLAGRARMSKDTATLDQSDQYHDDGYHQQNMDEASD